MSSRRGPTNVPGRETMTLPEFPGSGVRVCAESILIAPAGQPAARSIFTTVSATCFSFPETPEIESSSSTRLVAAVRSGSKGTSAAVACERGLPAGSERLAFDGAAQTRVTFEVEPTRVEQSTNYDKLVIDIETDGSITPVDSLASAGATLRSLVDLVANLTLEPMGLELGEVVGYSSGTGDLDMPIEDLDLSERPRNCLKRGQVHTIGELLTRSEEDLMNITNFGQKSLDEIKQKLDERGLSLRI